MKKSINNIQYALDRHDAMKVTVQWNEALKCYEFKRINKEGQCIEFRRADHEEIHKYEQEKRDERDE